MGRGRALRARRWGSIFVLTGMLLATSLSGVALAANANLNQCANGKVGDPREACSWQNGNLNQNNSQYAEGDGVAFRSVLTDLEVGDQYVFTVGWDTVLGTAIAYDHLVSWNQTETGDPAEGTTFATDPPDSLHAIPVDPRIANAGVTPVPGDIVAWGGTLTAVGNYQYQSGTASDPLPMSTMETTVDITFTANSESVVVAWGGHIATRADWNPGRTTAVEGVQGAPYHMRLTSLYNATDDETARLGNLDRSLDADLIVQAASLGITKTASLANVAPGGSLSYTVTVTNTGDGDATNVVVTDTVDGAFTVTGVSPSQGTCDPPSNAVNCALGTISAGGASATVTISVSVPGTPDSCRVVGNVASVDDDVLDAPLDSENVEVTITGCAVDLSLVKANDTGGEAASGESFDWTLTATNDASATATATDVQVADTIPAGLTVTNLAPDAGVDCSASSGNDIDCTIETLAPGDSTDIVVTVSVPEVDACGRYPNTGTLLDDQQIVDSDDDTVDVTNADSECAANVAVTKNVSSAEVGLGGSVTYTLVVTNAPDATATANDVVITDLVPEPLLVTNVASGDADCSASIGNLVSCDAGDLAPGQSAAVAVDVVVPSDGAVCNPYANVVEVSVADHVVDSDSANVTVVGCDPAIAVIKTADADEVDGEKVTLYDPGDGDDETISYVYEITNIGTVSLTDVTLVDDVLGQLLSAADGVTLEPGESTTVMAQHVLTAADASAGQVLNVATTTGTDPVQQIVSDSDTEVVRVAQVVQGVLGDPPTLPQADPTADPPNLPRTGGEVVPLFGVSNILLALGAAAVRLARRPGDRFVRSTKVRSAAPPAVPRARRHR